MKVLTFVSFAAIALVLVLALPVQAVGFPGSTEEGQEEYVTKKYDLSGFLDCSPYMHQPEKDETLALIPFHPDQEELFLREREYFQFSPDYVYEMLYRIIGEERFDHNHLLIETKPECLLIRAPESIHETVVKVIAFLDAVLNRDVRIDLEFFGAVDTKSLNASDAKSLRLAVENGALDPLLKRSVEVRMGTLFEVLDGSSCRIVYDQSTEIAQQANISEPMIEDLFTGLRLAVRPLPAPDGNGLLIGLYALASRLTGPVVTRQLLSKGRVCSESRGVEELDLSQDVDDPRIEFASLASIIRTDAGIPRTMCMAFPHQNGVGSLVMLITAHRCEAPDVLKLDDGAILSAWDFSHYQAKKLLPLFFRRDTALFWDWTQTVGSEYGNVTTLGSPAELCSDLFEEEFASLLTWGFIPGLGGDSEEAETFLFGDHLFLISGSNEYASFDKAYSTLLCEGFEGVKVDLEFIEMQGKPGVYDPESLLENGVRSGLFSIPMIHAGVAASYAGLEGLMVYYWDVDVATNSAVPNPRIAGFLDGAYVYLKHEPSTVHDHGSGTVRARICLNMLKGPISTMEMGGLLGVLDKPEFDTGFIDCRIKADGTWHLLGSLSGERDGKQKTLYVIGKAR